MPDDGDPLSLGSGYAGAIQTQEAPPQQQPLDEDPVPQKGVPRAVGIAGPPDASGYRKPYDTSDAYLEERARNYEFATKQVNDYIKAVTPYKEQQLKLLQQPTPKIPPKMAYPAQPDVLPPDPSKQVHWHATGIMALAMLLPELTKRGQYGRNNSFPAMGGAMANTQNAINGKYWGDAAQQWQEYNLMKDRVDQYNKDSLDNYQRVMSNRQLELDDKVKIISMLADVYLDPVVKKLALDKNIPGIMDEFEKKETLTVRQNNAWEKWREKSAEDIFNNPEMRTYASIVQSRNKDLDMFKLLQNRDWDGLGDWFTKANRVYPFEEFEHRGVEKQEAADIRKEQRAEAADIRKGKREEEAEKRKEKFQAYEKGLPYPPPDEKVSANPLDGKAATPDEKKRFMEQYGDQIPLP